MSLNSISEAPSPAGDTGLTDFFKDMSPSERRTFWGCAMAWTLDGMAYMIYPLLIGTIMAQWSVSPGRAGLAATVALLFSSVGGWAAGYVSDRFGRVRTLQLCVIWFSAFSLFSAVAQSFNELLVCRALLGLGFGGTWTVGAVLVGETVRARYRGRAVGCVQSGWAVGWGVAVLGQAILFLVFPPEIAWRALFVVGSLPALLLVYYIGKHVEEPSVASAALAALSNAERKPRLREIFSGRLLKTTVLASAAIVGAQGGYYAVNTWLPKFLATDRGLSIIGSTGYLALLIGGGFVGFLVGAWLADRIGRRLLFLVFSVGAVGMILLYTQFQLPNEVMLFVGFPLGFFTSGYFSGMGAFLTELYPTSLRGSGTGFCYNFGRAVGAVFPALVGYLSTLMPLANAMAVLSIVAYGLFFVTTLALPETRGRSLHFNA